MASPLTAGAALRARAQALVNKLDEVHQHPGFQTPLLWAYVRGFEYVGPTYGEELEALREALAAADAAPPPQEDGVRFDEQTGTWVARYTLLTAANSEAQAHEALASAVQLLARSWPPRVSGEPAPARPEVVPLYQAIEPYLWQSMATAPKDGTLIWLAVRYSSLGGLDVCGAARWETIAWYTQSGKFIDGDKLGWCPLPTWPAPPASAATPAPEEP